MTTEKQAHWRELQTQEKVLQGEEGKLHSPHGDYAQQINDIEGKLGLQVTNFETPTETKEEELA